MRYILLTGIFLCYAVPALAAEPFVCAEYLDVASAPSHGHMGRRSLPLARLSAHVERL